MLSINYVDPLMKVAIITDTHYGARKSSKLFHDYFEKFYNEIFFPTLDKEGITTVIHMGDAFDSRKGIDFKALDWAKRVVFDPLKERGITMHLMVGNHDAYYKNTNNINSIDLLLNEYDNVITYSEATEVVVDKTFCFIPWINEDNQKKLLNLLKIQLATTRWGTLNSQDLDHKHLIMDHGMEIELYQKFTKVFRVITIQDQMMEESST